jgi:malate dehydrogenase (oxaloacetate-decarboxylating)(NADP+)
MCDSKGVIRKDRENLAESKAEFATARDLNTLEDAMVGADVFVGLSIADVVDTQMLLSLWLILQLFLHLQIQLLK